MSVPIYDLTPQQTNDGDWIYTWQFLDSETGEPIFPGTPPVDLVVTLKLVRPHGETAFMSASNDGDGIVTLLDNSYIDFKIPYTTMQSLCDGRYCVHLQFDTTGSRITSTIGYLPLIRGPQ